MKYMLSSVTHLASLFTHLTSPVTHLIKLRQGLFVLRVAGKYVRTPGVTSRLRHLRHMLQ